MQELDTAFGSAGASPSRFPDKKRTPASKNKPRFEMIAYDPVGLAQRSLAERDQTESGQRQQNNTSRFGNRCEEK